MIERRALKRVATKRLALHYVKGFPGVHPCIVKDLNTGGAGLQSDWCPASAGKLVLSFDGFWSSIYCRIVWRSGSDLGVVFINRDHDVPTAHSETTADILGTPSQ